MGRISKEKAELLLWSIRRSGLGDDAINPVSPEQYSVLRRRHPLELAEAIQAYARSIATPTLSKRRHRPKDVSAADWLVSMAPHLSEAPLALWPGRHKSRMVRRIAELYAFCPDIVLDARALEGSVDGSASLVETLFRGSAWAIEALTRPFYNPGEVDRRSSFIGGIPWTCEAFPWPSGRSETALSPLFQLNLAELDLALIAEFPPVLVQGWGDETNFITRVILLSEIAGRSPASHVPAWEQKHLGYLRNDRGSIGATLSTGRSCFSVETGNIMGLTEMGLDPRYEAALGARATRANHLVDRIHQAALEEHGSCPEFAGSNHFGGQHHPRQWPYWPWEGSSALFEYHSFYGWPEEEDGLNIFFDGSMQVSFSPSDLLKGYKTEGSR
jgi:hypothetical protein